MENFFETTLRAEYQKSEYLIGGNFKFFKLLVSPKKNKNWKFINGDFLKLLGVFFTEFLAKNELFGVFADKKITKLPKMKKSNPKISVKF